MIGKLRQKDWGAKMGCPGIELNKNGEEIKGLIFKSENLSNNWNMLDDFEGEEYKRVITQAKLQDGSMVEAYIYVLRNG